jgi:sugar lactone lactonase YvrE
MRNIIFKSLSLVCVLALVGSCGKESSTVPSNPYQQLPASPLPALITNNLPTGNVTGRVIDYQTKTGISGVKVEILGVRPAVATLTDANGNFTLNRAPQGRQVLTVTKKNYSNSTNSNIVVEVKAGSTTTSNEINMFSSTLTSSNAFVKSFDGFKHPRGLSLDIKSNEIYVVDVIGIGGFFKFDRSEIKKISADGGIIDAFGSRIINADLRNIDAFRLLEKATGIGVDAGGNVYVADTGNNVVKKYGPNGRYLNQIKKDFKDLIDVAVTTTGDVIVSDPGNSRIALLDSSLNIRIENLLKDRPSDGVRGIATDNGDNIYIIDASGKPGEMIKKFDRYGNRLPLQFGRLGGLDPGNFSNPTDLAIDNKSGDIYVVDSGNNRVQRFSPEGSYLSEFGQFGIENGSFNSPWGIAIDSDGYIYVSDSKNSRVQKFMPGRIVANPTTYPVSNPTTPIIQPTTPPSNIPL